MLLSWLGIQPVKRLFPTFLKTINLKIISCNAILNSKQIEDNAPGEFNRNAGHPQIFKRKTCKDIDRASELVVLQRPAKGQIKEKGPRQYTKFYYQRRPF